MQWPNPRFQTLLAALVSLAFGTSAAGQEMMAEEFIGKFTVYNVEGRAALADEGGAVLYTNEDDPFLQSVCTGACAQAWPPAIAIPADTGFQDFQIIVRPDGVRQWAYRGHPLYRSVLDPGPGVTKAIGIDGLWYVVRIKAHFMP